MGPPIVPDDIDHRTLLLQHLAVAERHVAEGEERLVKQEALILHLGSAGFDTDQACAVLDTMRASQTLYYQDRDRIQRELEE